MEIDNALILKLETLTKLELAPEARKTLALDLTKILAMVEKLNELDTEGIKPLIYVGDAVNVWREDEVRNQISKEQALLNAPERNEDYFLAPKVVQV